MIDLIFDKLYRYDRVAEPCFIGIPVKRGLLRDAENVRVLQDGRECPVQARVTGRHPDGSVRFVFVRFLADLPGNRGAVLQCDLGAAGGSEGVKNEEEIFRACGVSPVRADEDADGITVTTDALTFRVSHGADGIFTSLTAAGRTYGADQFQGILLRDGAGRSYRMRLEQWEIAERGPVCVILKAKGAHLSEGARRLDCEVRLTAYAGKPWAELSYRIINTTDEELRLASLTFSTLLHGGAGEKRVVLPEGCMTGGQPDSTGCGDVRRGDGREGPIYQTSGTGELAALEQKASAERIRTCVAASNYKTSFTIGRDGAAVCRVVDAQALLGEGNEHFAEVLYGTFMADCTDAEGGVCATVFQAQQNYPKAVLADADGVTVMLVPEGVGEVVLQPGMAREQRMLLHFHETREPLAELDNRSLIYQMPDRPYLRPEVHQASGVWQDVFADRTDPEVERYLIGCADGHGRAYGMLNFGDSYDSNYTAQGRAGGDLVWCNNEYDYPHACALLYVRTGIRRFLDYNIASCSHWMDVDVCHYHPDPLYIGGQWEHTGGHTKNGVMVCSHEWVEGLLDYYHLTGDERGLETALGIGENILRLLETPMYAQVGEVNARETGWALRTLTALYVETCEAKWIERAERILEDFRVWGEQYGSWLAPYTDNTVIRVGFMISVAVGSLARYWRVRPDEDARRMILAAVDDLIENCYQERTDLFDYKELPSLNRLGNNTLLLEALAIAYEMTGKSEYLKPGLGTFRRTIRGSVPGAMGRKHVVGDAVLVGDASSKTFAQSMIPLATYYQALCRAGLDWR